MAFKEYDYLNDSFLHEMERLSNNNLNIYYLIHAYFSVNRGGENFYDAWIFEELNSWAIGVRIDGMYLIYGNSCDDLIISKIHERINNNEVEYLSGFHFCGTKVILDKLFIKANFNFEVYKERYYYTLTKKNFIPINSVQNILIRKSVISDLQVIAKMNSDFNTEEWNGKNNRSVEDFEALIRENVRSGKFFLVEFNNEVVGFCSVMNFLSKVDNMIGTVYICDNYRNKNLGTHLLSSVLKNQLDHAEEIYLMTDRQNLPSNKMVENLGFEKNYEYSDLIFKK
jgi:RimJ/RimL family protein N-acetyltransferase